MADLAKNKEIVRQFFEQIWNQGDESAIDCDVSCECQPITQGVGCTVSINDRAEDPFAKGITDADGLVSEVNIDNSSADKVAFVGSLVLSTVVSFLL